MTSSKRPEPTPEQLRDALARLHAYAPHIWPPELEQLGENAAKLVRARALQAMGETDLRSREQIALPCTLPSGAVRTRWVFGPLTNQLALDKDLT